ncbi:MAG: MlaD family protein [Trichlorobacter sp.]|nr:MlaD family protein [Trichlorobacter sp.]
MKRSNQIGWAQVRAGIFILVTLILFGGAVLLMGQKTKMFIPTSRLTVTMDNVAGLKEGAPVWLAGVDVGVVQKVAFADPKNSNDVRIEMEVEREALKKVGKDSRIIIKTRGLMGEKYVDIMPSSQYHQEPGSNFQGKAVPTIDDVAQKAGIAFDKLNSVIDNMQAGEGTLGKLATDTALYENALKLSSELKTLAASINNGQGTLGKLVRSGEPYDKLMQILARADQTLFDIQNSDGSLNRLIYDKTLYTKLVTLTEKGQQAADDVRALNQMMLSKDSTIGMLLTDKELYNKGLTLLAQVETTMQNLETTSAQLHTKEGTAGRLLNDNELYEKLSQTVNALEALINDVKTNPGRYVKFSLF